MLEHGGNLHDAVRAFGRPLADWLDLSTGINPVSYPVPAIPAAAWQRLPETSDALLAAACAYYGAPQLLAVAGSQAAIQGLPRLQALVKASAPARVLVAAPSYAEHAHQWRAQGHAVRECAYEALAAQLDWAEVVVLCNPNNPTGARLPAATLLDWAAQLGQRGGWLVVDEAFADSDPRDSVAAHAGMPGLIVLRSLGKFFGLAGLRVGFVAAEAALLRGLADYLGPWCISGPAQSIACAALQDRAWQHAMRGRLQEQGARLHALLGAHGLAGSGTALFQWCSDAALERRTEALWQHMAERGIWLRLFRAAARGVRFGLPGDAAGWQRLEMALDEWRKTYV